LQIDEYQSKLQLKDKYIRELKAKIDVLNENAMRQDSVIQVGGQYPSLRVS